MSTRLFHVTPAPTAAAAWSCSFLQPTLSVPLRRELPAPSPAKRLLLQRPVWTRLVTSGRAAPEPVDVVSPDSASLLEGVKVLDLDGKAVPLLDLWSERRAVIGFARHFGCVFCRKRADILASKKDVMDAAGVALVLIGPGSVEQAKACSQQTSFTGEVYADLTHSSFEALNFVSGVSTTFTPSAGLKIIQLYMEGYRQDWELSFQKDTVERGGWQQGGTLVAGPGKSNILYVHKDKEAGDDPDVEEVLKACCK